MKKLLYYTSILILAFIPLIVASTIIYAISGEPITEFHLVTSIEAEGVPSLPNIDELYHWHQIQTFRSVGFEGGYYTVAENTAESEMFRFFAWGPFPTIFYGIISTVTGFDDFTMIFINIVLFALGVIVMGFTVKLEPPQIIMLGLLFAFMPNIVISVPSTGLGMLNIIVGLYIAVATYHLLSKENPPSVSLLLILSILLLSAGLFRVSWAIIFPPIFGFIGWKFGRWFGAFLGIMFSIMCGVIIYYIFGYTAAPFDSLISLADSDSQALVASIVNRALYNLSNILFGLSFWVLLRFAALIIIIGVAYQVVLILMKKSELYSVAEVLFHLINIAGILLANLLIYFYVEGRDFRTIGPHLLLSLILLILFKRYRLVFPVLMIFVFGFPNMLQSHVIWKQPHFVELQFDYESYERQLAENNIVYIETDNGWCNTVIYSPRFRNLPEYLISLNGGFGLTQLGTIEDYDDVPKSQYLILENEIISDALEIWNLEPLITLPYGIIYRNLDADCL